MTASLARLVLGFVFLVALAIAAPHFAPELLATYLKAEEPAAVAVAAPPAKPKPRPGHKVAIDADARGHFVSEVVIEGRSIPVVVDTGATLVALTADTARRLGIQLTPSDYTAVISTANGTVGAAPVTLSEIRLGTISVRNVAAIVVPGNALEINLLGMSFLSRLRKFEIGGGQLVLVE